MARLDAIMARLRATESDHGVAAEGPSAAVAAILREVPGSESAEVFFIERAQHPNDPWSGHIAFPGGRREPEDMSLLATAIRETREEVGIDLSLAHLIGRLPDVPTFARSKRGNMVVTPFVFGLRSDVDVIRNNEVASTLWVPLTTLALGVGKATFELDYEGRKYDLPYVHLEPGRHRLWGMTYRMMETLVEAVL